MSIMNATFIKNRAMTSSLAACCGAFFQNSIHSPMLSSVTASVGGTTLGGALGLGAWCVGIGGMLPATLSSSPSCLTMPTKTFFSASCCPSSSYLRLRSLASHRDSANSEASWRVDTSTERHIACFWRTLSLVGRALAATDSFL